ncbi:Cytidine deaminase 1 [Hibiscus syriacus]|uniref:Cytidine deaminase 1 n=1 Tax=Hibiscus syriacus TaxID=106335 RepID=A0A6A3A8P2_HIBSY|nr:Cytidine deaminase 1 [Hibiscus syriacus]
MDRLRFVIDSAEAEEMAKQSGQTVLQLLRSLVKTTQILARPPISKFHVGAVGMGSSGRIFFGVNLEFPGLPLNQSVHAEQFLITNLSLNAEQCLKYLAVSAAPCGHCRPRSGCPSGVALLDVEGKIYKGSYMESAAYNPSLPPAQAALVAYVASGGGGGGL